MDGKDLRNCPFCGGKAHLETWKMTPYERLHFGGYAWYGVFCDNCGASGPDCTDEYEAKSLWNTRVKGW